MMREEYLSGLSLHHHVALEGFHVIDVVIP